jgi:alkylhydroperoxidase family enzyme
MLRRIKRPRNVETSNSGPELLRAIARSPAALAGYLGLQNGLMQGQLSAPERCLVGLMVAQRSGSSYWLSVQAREAQQAGLTKEQIGAAREGCADTDRVVALLFLAGKLVTNRRELTHADLDAARQAGLSDSEIIEVVFHVASNLAAASVSHATGLQLDFPPAPPLPAF